MATIATLRDYQLLGVRLITECMHAESRLCLAAPTGTGKSIIELTAQEQMPGVWIITPRIEIIKGMMDKRGVTTIGETDLVEQAWAHRITTPIRFRNALMAGELAYEMPLGLIVDEGHHIEAETYQQILLCIGKVGVCLLTGSPFRGTPRSTAKFRETWGQPKWLITYREAIDRQFMRLPIMKTVPLVDDDLVEIGSNGELQISSINKVTRSRLDSIVDLMAQYWDPALGLWDKPTIVSLPSTELVYDLNEKMHARGLPCTIVVQDTKFAARELAFAYTLAKQKCLLQINVVSEGVDLPLRRLVDCSPTLSPVKWVQQVGRITRFSDVDAEYICTNRNLLRHAYLLDGVLPAAPLVEACQVWGGPSKRAGSRVIGLEALGRLKPATVPLAGGMEVVTYAVACSEQNRVVEYFVILHPRFAQPIWARREDAKDAAGNRLYGKWKPTAAPDNIEGFASLAPKTISEKQMAWWERSAKGFGLDCEHQPTRKTFQILPVLKDLGLKLQS